MHRDVSIGNIMVDESGRGILIDWDTSSPFPRTSDVRAPYRSVSLFFGIIQLGFRSDDVPGILREHGNLSPQTS